MCSLWVWKFWVSLITMVTTQAWDCPSWKTESLLISKFLSRGTHFISSPSDISTKKRKKKEKKKKERKEEGKRKKKQSCSELSGVCIYVHEFCVRLHQTYHLLHNCMLHLSTHLGKTSLAQISKDYINYLSLFPDLQPDTLKKHSFPPPLSDSSKMKKD